MSRSVNRLLICLVLPIGLGGLAGCEQKASEPVPTEPGGQPQPRQTLLEGDQAMDIQSSAFSNSQPIPRQYTGDGQDVAAPLSFSAVPPGTVELALICDDPDAPRPEPWVHWVIYKIPADASGLAEGVPRQAQLSAPLGAIQGENSWPADNIGYRGPLPPKGHGVHRYYFKLYALDQAVSAEAGLDKAKLLADMKGHILAKAQLVGTYQR